MSATENLSLAREQVTVISAGEKSRVSVLPPLAMSFERLPKTLADPLETQWYSTLAERAGQGTAWRLADGGEAAHLYVEESKTSGKWLLKTRNAEFPQISWEIDAHSGSQLTLALADIRRAMLYARQVKLREINGESADLRAIEGLLARADWRFTMLRFEGLTSVLLADRDARVVHGVDSAGLDRIFERNARIVAAPITLDTSLKLIPTVYMPLDAFMIRLSMEHPSFRSRAAADLKNRTYFLEQWPNLKMLKLPPGLSQLCTPMAAKPISHSNLLKSVSYDAVRVERFIFGLLWSGHATANPAFGETSEGKSGPLSMDKLRAKSSVSGFFKRLFGRGKAA
ncbi:MAG: hypothetical protein ACRCWJ_06140 [Casimicrobium sp.]